MYTRKPKSAPTQIHATHVKLLNFTKPAPVQLYYKKNYPRGALNILDVKRHQGINRIYAQVLKPPVTTSSPLLGFSLPGSPNL